MGGRDMCLQGALAGWCQAAGGSSWRVCLLGIHPSVSPLENFNTHTWHKKKLLMSLVWLSWEPVANESLGLPLTFA